MQELGLGIISGHYPQGAVLPGDADLTERFGVSRTVLREAMKTLAGKGLLQAKARIGTRVRERGEWNLFDPDVLIWHAEAGFDPAFLTHLQEMRFALEPEAATLAAERRTPRQLETIMSWVDRMNVEVGAADDFVTADLNFHLAVAEAAANPFLHAISTLIEVALVALLRISSPVSEAERLESSIAKHRAIAEAIGRRDGKAANAAMRAVIEEGLAVTRAQRARGR